MFLRTEPRGRTCTRVYGTAGTRVRRPSPRLQAGESMIHYHVTGTRRAHAHVHTAGHILGQARCTRKSQTPVCTPTCIYKCENPPYAMRPPPMQPSTRHHTGTHLCAHRHTCARTTSSPRVRPPHACNTHSLGSGSLRYAGSIPWINKQGYTQTLHRRARTRVHHAHAHAEPPRAHSFPKGTRPHLPPLHRRAGDGGMGVGGEDRAGRGSRGPPPDSRPQHPSASFKAGQLRPLSQADHQSNQGYRCPARKRTWRPGSSPCSALMLWRP